MTPFPATAVGRQERGARPPASQIQLLVADAAVPEPDLLAAMASRPCRLMRLAAGDDGLRAVLDAMLDTGPVAALHVVAHGGPGRLRLGRTDITAAGLWRRRRAVAALAAALGGAPVLLYGCAVGAGTAGRHFVSALSAALVAPVRAASGPVGCAALGGAWNLDVGSGEAGPLFDGAGAAGWGHLLANTNLTTAGDLTATIEAASNGDTITLVTDGGAYTMNAASVASITLLLGGAVSSATVTPNNAAFAIQPDANVSSTFTVQADGGQTLTLNIRLADQGTGRLSLEKTGGGTLVLGNATAGTNTGTTTVSAGTLQVTGGAALSDSSAVSVAAGATLDLGGSSETIGGLSGAGDVSLGAGTLTVVQAGTGTFSGDISGSGNAIKAGTGTLTLSGGNSLTGTITVSAGILNVTGGIDGAVHVASGGTLTGTCSIAGALSVASGGSVAPGNSPGTAAVGGLSMAAGSTLNAEIDGTTAGTDYDQVAVTGTVDVTGATLSTTLGYAPTLGDSYVLVANDGVDAVTGAFSGLAEGATLSSGGRNFRISYVGNDGNDITLTHIASPADPSVIYGTPGPDRLFGTTDGDLVSALAGNDVVLGLDGNDTLHGSPGADELFGHDGMDDLFGGTEGDVAWGGNGDDLLYGNQGGDLVYGNPGTDTVFGGQDSDTAFGGQGGDLLYGNRGADLLHGNRGDDTLYGGQGNDTLSGGFGSDLLVGGIGADRHAFGSGDGADRVSGFSAADGDVIAVASNANGSGISGVGDLLARLSTDSQGNAVLDLGLGNAVTLLGVPPVAVVAEWLLVI